MSKKRVRSVPILLIAILVVGIGIMALIGYSFIAFQGDFSEDILPGESSEACVALSGKVGIVESQYLCSTEGVTGFSVSLGEGIDSFRAVFSGDSGSEEVVIRDGESSSNLRMLTKGFNEPLEVGLGSLVYVYSGGFDSVEVYPVSSEGVCGLADSKIINPCSAVIGTLISIDNTDDEQLQESNESVEEETNQGGGGGGSSGGSGGSSGGSEDGSEDGETEPEVSSDLSINLISPFDGEVLESNESVPLEFVLSNYSLADSCWYSLDGNDNVSLPGCSNSTFDVSDGTHIIIVYANDTDGNVVSDGNSFAYDISFPPVVSFSASVTSGFEPLSVDFDASDSSDPDGEIVSYSWDFDNDGTEDATGVTTSNVFSAGSYVVNLTVTDDDGLSGSFTRDIEVFEDPNVYYSSPEGGQSECSSSSPCSLEFLMGVVQPGDIVLLNPGNYGDVVFEEPLGSEGAYVVFRANPSTTVSRPSDWFVNGVPYPDASDSVIFDSLVFEYFRDSSTNKSIGKYIEVDGVNVIGSTVRLKYYVSHVILRNMNLFGAWGNFSSELNSGFDIRPSASQGLAPGSDFSNILIEENYITDVSRGIFVGGINSGNLTIKGNHVNHTAGSAVSIQVVSENDPLVIKGNHLHYQESLADTLKHTREIDSVDESNPFKIFFINEGDISFFDSVVVESNSTGQRDLRAVESYNSSTLEVVVEENLSFIPEPGDIVEFWDNTHGSGIAIREENYVIDGNIVYNNGGTRAVYLYGESGGAENIIFTNNLVYGPHNSAGTVDFSQGIGNNWVIENNTIIGIKGVGYSTSLPQLYYGYAFRTGLYEGTDPSTVIIKNNLLVGRADFIDNAIIEENIAYYNSNPTAEEGENYQNNLIFYQGESFGLEPHSFDGSGVFFIGGDSFDEFDFGNRLDLYLADELRPLTSSEACNGFVSDSKVGALECISVCVDDNPAAIFTVSQSQGFEPLSVDFDASSSEVCGSASSIVNYSWNFGDGTEISGSNLVQTSHDFSAGGHVINLTVTDNLGNKNSRTSEVLVFPSPEPGLLLHYNFDNQVNDLSGRGFDGQWQGCEANYTFGLINEAGVFGNCSVLVPNEPELRGMEEVTFSIWAKKNSSDSFGNLFAKHTHYDNRISSEGNAVFVLYSETDSATITAPDFQDEGWHHYVMTYNGSLVRAYIDGVEVGSDALSGNIKDADFNSWAHRIGSSSLGGGDNFFGGLIDEYKIYNRALNDSEILNIYNSALADEVSGPQAIARWDVVPYQTFDGDFEIGVVAFHKDGIDNVTFEYVDKNGIVQGESVSEMSLNPRTDVWEYWITLSASDFNDGPIMINATAYPNNGEPRVLAGNINESSIDNGEYSLFLNANSGGSLWVGEKYVSWENGSDITGDGTFDNPYQSVMRAARTAVSENPEGVADGLKVYLLPGTHEVILSGNNAEGTFIGYAPTRDRYIDIRPAPGLTKDNVTLASYKSRTHLVRVSDVVMEGAFSTQIPTDGSEPFIWGDDIFYEGDGQEDVTPTFSSQVVGTFQTNSVLQNRQAGWAGTSFLRNSEARNIGGDPFTNIRFAVNVRAPNVAYIPQCRNGIDDDSDGFIDYPNDPECSSANDNGESQEGYQDSIHSDIIQYFRTDPLYFENIIIFGLKAVNHTGQGWHIGYTGHIPGPDWEDIALVNILIQTNSGNPPISQWIPSADHVLFWHHTHTGQQVVVRNNPNGEITRVTNFDMRNNFFNSFGIRDGPEEPSLDNQSWAYNNHYFDIDIFGSDTPGEGATTEGDYLEMFVDAENNDFSPVEGSILIGSNRPVSTDLVVPVDVNNNVRPSDGSASIGALEFGSSVQGVQFSDEITQYNITWTFSEPVQYGQFANGDYWVLGPVSIVNITPEFTGDRHGWEVDPVVNPTTLGGESLNGFDSRITGFNSSFVPPLPYTAAPGELGVNVLSLVKAVSRPPEDATEDECGTGIGSDRGCLASMSILSVVSEVPENNGQNLFRPSYVKLEGNKTFYRVSDLQTELLPSLAHPNNYRDLDWVVDRFGRPHPDHIFSVHAQRLHVRPYMESYGADYARQTAEGALALMLDDPIVEKMEPLIGYVQVGIDYYGMLDAGHRWVANGGHSIGRKLPMIFAAVMLNNDTMKSKISSVEVNTFHEDGMLHSSENAGNLTLFGQLVGNQESSYWTRTVTGSGAATIRDPYGLIDGGGSPGTSYQICCNSMPYKYTMLAMELIPDMKDVWNYESFFNYTQRWVDHGTWSQPDVCAPAEGVCVGGDNEGGYCNTAGENGVSSCGGTGGCNTYCSGGGTCSYSFDNYGITYGPDPDNPDSCILDENDSDGIGRFPLRHTQGADSGGRQSSFGNDMWNLYRYSQSSVCGNDIVEPGEQCDDGNTDDSDGCSSSCQLETEFSEPGLDGYYKFNENNLLSVADLSGNDNHANIISPSGLIYYSEGVEGLAIVLPGENGYCVNLPSSAFEYFNELSVSAWVKSAEDSLTASTIFAKGAVQSSAGNERYFLDVLTNGNPRFRISNGTSQLTATANIGYLVNGQWYHIAGVFNGTSVNLYVDGELADSASDPNFGSINPSASSSAGIGCRATGSPTRVWNGSIDEVRIYDRALDDSEILNIYNSAFEPLSSPVEQNGMWENLIENIRQLFSISLSRTLYDSSGNYGSGITGRAVDSSGNGTSGGFVFVFVSLLFIGGVLFYFVRRNRINRLRKEKAIDFDF